MRHEDYSLQLSMKLKKQIPGSRRGFKDFLYHINRNKSYDAKILKLKVPKQKPKTISKEKIGAIMDACCNIRDKFLIQLLWESSMRISEALALWLEDFDQENNPNKLLFVRLRGKRKRRPPEARSVSDYLNRLAKERNIVDDQGKVFHFKNHAFRHTKAIELINNGMNLLHVPKWMAHASPEMTLWYAKILDTTMRKSWEEATKQGLFRINESGKPIRIDISDIENEDIIEWEYIRHNLDAVRMPLGYCMKPKKQECHIQLNPCLTCRNLCTTPDFIPQYEVEIQETKAVIERGKAQNRSVWVEKNHALLERYESILAIFKNGKTHHKAGKKGREYVGEERNNG